MIADSFFFFFFYTAIFHRKIRIQNRVVFFPSSILITQSQRAKNYYQKSTSRKHLLEFYILYSIHFRRMDILSSNANYIKFIESLGAISCIFSYKISKRCYCFIVVCISRNTVSYRAAMRSYSLKEYPRTANEP